MATEAPGKLPLWDLTRGDADDNRSSPHGLGWRTLAISTALEFNYLTAAIAFVSADSGPRDPGRLDGPWRDGAGPLEAQGVRTHHIEARGEVSYVYSASA